MRITTDHAPQLSSALERAFNQGIRCWHEYTNRFDRTSADGVIERGTDDVFAVESFSEPGTVRRVTITHTTTGELSGSCDCPARHACTHVAMALNQAGLLHGLLIEADAALEARLAVEEAQAVTVASLSAPALRLLAPPRKVALA